MLEHCVEEIPKVKTKEQLEEEEDNPDKKEEEEKDDPNNKFIN